MVKKVVHLSSVHPLNDTRIFHKECKTLLGAGYDLTLVVQHDGDEKIEGVKIRGIEPPANRVERMIKTRRQLYRKALECNAEIYHFHDPELIPIGLRLKRKGKKVIYDVHEDVPRDILTKRWLPAPLRKTVSRAVERIEDRAAGKFDYIVAATPHIRNRFLEINRRTVDINNYPILSELYVPGSDWSNKENLVCFVGAIGRSRGIREMVEAIERTDSSLLLVGRFAMSAERDFVASGEGWSKVVELGHLDRASVKQVLARSMAGLVLFHPKPNHTDAQPNKMFEYMSAGIPVIGSDFPFWRDILEGNDCGICVNPFDIDEIAKAINWIRDNPGQASRMGQNGRKAVEEKYRWDIEAAKLLKIYGELLS